MKLNELNIATFGLPYINLFAFSSLQAFPNIHKRRSDQMATLFALCHKLQTQVIESVKFKNGN